MWKFSTKTEEWTNLGEILNERRNGHSCVVLEDMIIVSGGTHIRSKTFTPNSIEIIGIKELMNFNVSLKMEHGRYGHGLMVAHVQDQLSALAIGGSGWNSDRDSIEMFNIRTGLAMSEMKLSEEKYLFGYTSVPTSLVCRNVKPYDQRNETRIGFKSRTSLAQPSSKQPKSSMRLGPRTTKTKSLLEENWPKNWPKLAYGHYYLA